MIRFNVISEKMQSTEPITNVLTVYQSKTEQITRDTAGLLTYDNKSTLYKVNNVYAMFWLCVR